MPSSSSQGSTASDSGLQGMAMFLLAIIAFFAIGIILFLLFRVVMLWYWKVNKILEVLTEIEKNTRHSEMVPSQNKSVDGIDSISTEATH
ncbi:MAG TPA: hypothetical protein PKD79_02995 [Candidatus Doudnabacteria bacterium]|nr:hypothetical protein [Candidatus Doudnabacteria bacterium]